MRTLGIDPGAGGALALLDGRKLVRVWDMPTVTTDAGKRRIDASTLATTIVQQVGRVDLAIIEQVGPMPRDGSAGSFWFGKAAGIPEGVLAGLGIECRLVPPQTWKRRLDVPREKNAARARATTLFPGRGDEWPLVKHDGRAEAALIALWGYMDRVAGQW
jgi:crossover junction endodeoxyribonuclease RuvC